MLSQNLPESNTKQFRKIGKWSFDNHIIME